MIRKLLFVMTCVVSSLTLNAQCDSTNVPADYTISSDLLLSGTYVINGTFTVAAGATVFVTPHSSNGCGELKIYADNIIIEGSINGDFAGYEGGNGGDKGTVVSSLTGNEASLTSCDASGSQGEISVEGGFSGALGYGPGGGMPGASGDQGSGTKQFCGNLQDEAGLVGGAGGAGGGSGGSYGGQGSDGATGGNGSGSASETDTPIESSYTVVGGSGGTGGAAIAVYGTADGRDIDLGSGGAGAGAGGRSYYVGSNGTAGGAGGGMIFLKATNNLEISGTISVIGGDGSNGGDGGSGDATADCCSDPCNGCDERTFSAGAGAGSGAGGGSGGGIFIESLGTADVSGTLHVSGGNGGAAGVKGNGVTCEYDGGLFCGSQSITTGDGNDGGTGGAGGGGRIKIYVGLCEDATLNPTVILNAGTGNGTAEEGTYEEVCGYTASLNELEHSIGWSIYPNPFNDVLNIDIISGIDLYGENTLEIFNAFGQLVYSIGQVNEENTIDMSTMKAGIYTVRIISSDKSEIKRIVKQ